MSAPSEIRSTPTRRALLAGAVGGIGALAASAIGRPDKAAAVSYVNLGLDNAASTTTSITNTGTDKTVFAAFTGIGIGLWGASNSNKGIYGFSSSSIGVHGYSNTYFGIFGETGTGVGVVGNSSSGIGVSGHSAQNVAIQAANNATNKPASLGWSEGGSTGVLGASSGSIPAPKAKTGVYGYASQDSSSRGVWGYSPAGHGIHGGSGTGFAGYFSGKVFTTTFHEMQEISAPSAPAANRARLFLRDLGGKTQLCVKFSSGGALVLATQP